MAGGNAAMMSALMGSFADSYGGGNSGGGLSSALQAMRDPMYEASVKSQMDMDEIEYRTKQAQWLEDKKHEYDANQAKGLGQVTAQLQAQLGNKPNMSNDEKAYLGMLNTVGQSGLGAAIPAVLKMLEQGSGSYAKNFQKTPDMREYEAMQRDPGMAEYMQTQQQGALPAAIQIAQMLSDPAVPDDVKQNLRYAQKIDKSVENAGQVAQATAFGSVEGGATKPIVEQFGKEYNTVQEHEQNAVRLTDTVKAIDQEFGDSYTGAFGDDVTKIQKIAKALNIPVDPNLGNKEAAEALANQLALQLRSPAEGGGMPGSMSDLDREFLRSMTPGALMTREGRRELIKRYTKISARAGELANEADKYIQTSKNGSLDTGWNVQRRALKQRWDAEDKAENTPAPAAAPSAPSAPTTGWRVIR